MKTTAQLPPIQQVIESVLRSMGFSDFSVSIQSSSIPGHVSYNITGTDSALLIGRDGRNLEALSRLVREVVLVHATTYDSHFETDNFVVDVDGYQELEVKTMLGDLENKLIKFKTDQSSPIELEPMSSFHRRIVHSYIQNKPGLKTESVGVGQERKVIIKNNE